MTPACIIGISGYSGTGKTTLIEKALAELKKEGLSVGILKHTHHRLDFDIKGKDTDKFFKAGADVVFAHDLKQGFARYRKNHDDLDQALKQFPRELDLIIVEGHKHSYESRIWLRAQKQEQPGKKDISLVLDRGDSDTLKKFLEYIHCELDSVQMKRQIAAGLLIGGKSRRMGQPKALLKADGKTLVEKSFKTLKNITSKTLLLGSGQLPPSLKGESILPDVPDAAGPLAGMLSAFRWSPDSAWIISAVDMPLMSQEAWNWLLSHRRPGAWAVLPRLKGKRNVEPAGAVYEPMIFGYAESIAKSGLSSLHRISEHPKVISPVIPGSLAYAWENINTPEEWEKVLAGER